MDRQRRPCRIIDHAQAAARGDRAKAPAVAQQRLKADDMVERGATGARMRPQHREHIGRLRRQAQPDLQAKRRIVRKDRGPRPDAAREHQLEPARSRPAPRPLHRIGDQQGRVEAEPFETAQHAIHPDGGDAQMRHAIILAYELAHHIKFLADEVTDLPGESAHG
ncbi:MAG: hypothetical protein QM688_01700 [Sphingomonas bacterium]